MKIKILSVILIIIVIMTLTLFVLKKISTKLFWLIVIIVALIAYKGIPWLKKQQK